MPNKLTDEEVVKALKERLQENKRIYLMDIVFLRSLVDLIDCQKEEIESWQGGYMTQKQEIANLEIELKAMRGAANSYKAEIERLKKGVKCDD